MAPQDVHDAQKVYVEDLVKHFNIPKQQAWDWVRKMWPTIEMLSIEEDTATYRVTMSPFMNILAAIACGDHNTGFHTIGGYLQTLPLVGLCSAVTSAFCPGYALRRIANPVEFKAPVPIGEPALASVRINDKRGQFIIIDLDVSIESTGQDIFEKPRTLTMRRIDG